MTEITSVTNTAESDWLRIWKNCDYATYFHSPMWMNIWAELGGSGVRPASKTVTFSDGFSAIWVANTKTRLLGLIRLTESSAAHGYGGWVSADPLTETHDTLLMHWISEYHSSLNFRINPFYPGAAHLSESGISAEPDSTFVTILKQSNDELKAILKDKKITTKVRSAENKGLKLELISEQHLSDFLRIYQNAQQRWTEKNDRVTIYPASVFEKLFKCDYCDFWGVFKDEQLICAGPILTARRHAVSWLALAGSEFLNFKPYEFFYYHLIFHYKSKNFNWFDFNPSGKRTGVETFKSRFATTEMSTPVISQQTTIMRGLHKLKGWLS